jgi:hypothetical protein
MGEPSAHKLSAHHEVGRRTNEELQLQSSHDGSTLKVHGRCPTVDRSHRVNHEGIRPVRRAVRRILEQHGPRCRAGPITGTGATSKDGADPQLERLHVLAHEALGVAGVSAQHCLEQFDVLDDV